LAEDIGLEEVRIVQALKTKEVKAPSTLVPRIVPTKEYYSIITRHSLIK